MFRRHKQSKAQENTTPSASHTVAATETPKTQNSTSGIKGFFKRKKETSAKKQKAGKEKKPLVENNEEDNHPIAYAFTVGLKKGEQSTLAFAAQHFYPDHQIETRDIAQKDCFEDLKNENLRKLVFLGHASTKVYGSYNLKGFIKELEKISPEKRQYVKHLYVIGCELGLARASGTALAQEIVNQLHDKGFVNLKLHAIANPQEIPEGYKNNDEDIDNEDAMFVSVTTNAGIGAYEGAKEGYISAYILPKKEAEKLRHLSQHDKKHKEIMEEHAFVFIKNKNPQREYDREPNVFKPNETPEARANRINNHPDTMERKNQERVFKCLRARLEYEEDKNELKKARKLKFAIYVLERADDDDWQRMLKSFVKYFKFSIFGVKLNRTSNTLQMLEYLADEDYNAAETIINNQQSKARDRSPERTALTRSSDDEGSSKGKGKEKEKGKEKGKEKESENEGKKEKGKEKVTEHGNNGRKNPDESSHRKRGNDSQLENARDEIYDLIQALRGEIAGLKAHRFGSFFHAAEIGVKQSKMNALIDIRESESFNDLRDKAYEASGSFCVMWSRKTTRTKDLITKIVKRPHDFAPEQVQSASQKMKAAHKEIAKKWNIDRGNRDNRDEGRMGRGKTFT